MQDLTPTAIVSGMISMVPTGKGLDGTGSVGPLVRGYQKSHLDPDIAAHIGSGG